LHADVTEILVMVVLLAKVGIKDYMVSAEGALGYGTKRVRRGGRGQQAGVCIANAVHADVTRFW
jgi:hypothetical protein